MKHVVTLVALSGISFVVVLLETGVSADVALRIALMVGFLKSLCVCFIDMAWDRWVLAKSVSEFK